MKSWIDGSVMPLYMQMVHMTHQTAVQRRLKRQAQPWSVTKYYVSSHDLQHPPASEREIKVRESHKHRRSTYDCRSICRIQACGR
jgi:hypothetical protein